MKNKFFYLLAIIIVITLSGCTISLKGSGGSIDGGVYLSKDKGNTWSQRVLVPTVSGRPISISTLNASSFAMDPNDSKALYFGSVENGLFYTYNEGKEWQIAKGLGRVTVSDVAVDYESKCIIYASVDNKVYKSTDCNRSWAQVYYDNNIETRINSIVIDHYNPKNIYIGTSRGEIIYSANRGVAWKTLNRFDASVERIIISPYDSRVIFVATRDSGIFRSKDAGKSWENIEEKIEEKGNIRFRDIVFSKSEKDLILLASDYGLNISKDLGDTWKKIELITPKKDAIIYSVAINPKDIKEIYYVTNTTFYSSKDGGENWTTRKLPSTRAGWRLLINYDNPDIIYLAVRKIK